MTKPVRLQLSRAKGFRLQAASLAANGLPAVKVARPTMWGNYAYAGPRTGWLWRAGAVQAFRAWVELDASSAWKGRAAIDLRGKNLACWCPLPKLGEPDLCHAAVLLEIANG